MLNEHYNHYAAASDVIIARFTHLLGDEFLSFLRRDVNKLNVFGEGKKRRHLEAREIKKSFKLHKILFHLSLVQIFRFMTKKIIHYL